MRTATIVILVTLAAALIGWDIAAYVIGGSAATVSVVLADFLCRHPWALLGIGFLGGHIAWPAKAR